MTAAGAVSCRPKRRNLFTISAACMRYPVGGIRPLSTPEPNQHGVLEYASAADGGAKPRRTGLRLLSVLMGAVGLLAFVAGSAIVVLVVSVNVANRGDALMIAGVYLGIAGVCAFAAIRWGRTAFEKRRGPRE